MKNVRFLLLLSGLFLAAIPLRAQDLIYRLNPVQTIEGKVTEIGETNIRYTRTDTRSDVVFNIPAKYIQKIVFEDGKELVYNDVVDVSHDRKNAIKLGFLSPAWNATTLYYERSLKTGQSLELGVGVIGLGLEDYYDDESGILIKAGYKFLTRPEFYQNRFRYAHLLKGSYIKPEITFVHYSASETFNGGCEIWDGNRDVTLFNFAVIGGKQWVFQNSLLLDLYAGIGFNVGDTDNYESFHYAFTGDVITFTAGFKIGFLF